MLKAGIIGLGHGSRVLIDAFKLNNIQVIGVNSKNYSNAKNISKKKGIHKTYHDWKTLVSDDKIDIVAIAVPPILQIEIIKECLKKNKIIFCEKPLGTKIKKINNLFSLLHKKNKFIFMDYFFKEHEAFIKYSSLLKKIKVNKNDYVEVNFATQTYANKNKIINWKSNLSKGGGVVNIFFPHIIDYLIWFFGPIKTIKCIVLKKRNRATVAECLIKFKSTIIAKILVNSDNPRNKHLIQYNSKKCTITLKNSGTDYGKRFAIIYKKYKKNNKSKNIKILFNNKIEKFKGDSRILLTSRIVKLIKNGLSKKYQNRNLKRYHYNEKILNYIQMSIKKNREIKVQ